MRRAVSVACVLVFLQAGLRAAPDFDALGRAVVDELAARSFEKVVERFDQKMTAALPGEKLAGLWDGIVGKAGPFKRVTAVRIQAVPKQPAHVVDLTSGFEKAIWIVRVAFNDDGQIIGLFFAPALPPSGQTPAPAGQK